MKIIWSVRLPFVSNSEKCSTRLSSAILDKKYYKYMDLKKHINLSYGMSKLANYIFCSWIYQSNQSGVEIYLSNVLRQIVHNFDQKSKCHQRKLRSEFLNKCVTELSMIGWDIIIIKKDKTNKLKETKLIVRHSENPYDAYSDK